MILHIFKHCTLWTPNLLFLCLRFPEIGTCCVTVAYLSGGDDYWEDDPIVLLRSLWCWNKDGLGGEQTLLVPGLQDKKTASKLCVYMYRLSIRFPFFLYWKHIHSQIIYDDLVANENNQFHSQK